MAAEPGGAAAERVLRGQPVPLQRRHDHHAAAGGHPVGCAVARLLRGQAVQRLPGRFGDQPRRVPLRHRQGRRQGHHVARRAARHRAATAAWRPSANSATRSPRPNSTTAARAQGVTIGRGDIVLVRTGWWARFLETGDGAEPGAGLDWTCASWLHDHEVAAGAACASAGRRPRRRTPGSRPSGCRRRRANAEDGQKGAMSLAQYLINLVKTKMEDPPRGRTRTPSRTWPSG